MILTTFFGLVAWGQVVLPGSQLTLEQAEARAAIITTGQITRIPKTLGLGSVRLGHCDLNTSAAWRVKGWDTPILLQDIPIQTSGPEVQPKVGETYLFFIQNDGGHSGHHSIIKVLADTPNNRAAIELVIQMLILPGSQFSIEQAKARSHTIVVGQPTHNLGGFGSGGAAILGYDFKSSAVLKGEPKKGDWQNLGVLGFGAMPEIGREYVIFIEAMRDGDQRSSDHVLKLLPSTPQNIQAVKQADSPAPQNPAAKRTIGSGKIAPG